jgi:methylenetetrahydrofolate reductase (NADPH)
MEQIENHRRILVVSSTPELAEISRKAVEGSDLEVDFAPNEEEGWRTVSEKQPAVVILGHLETPGAVIKFYRRLREGWISHHASLLIVELNTPERSFRILSDENLTAGIGKYTFLEGAESQFIPQEQILSTLSGIINNKFREKSNKFRASILDQNKFCLVWEQIPGLGAFEMRQEAVIENAGKAARGGKICAISITDNPGGNPAIATDVLCTEIRKLGIEPIVHIAFRDRSRNQVESLLYQLEALAVNNVLVLTGDYPSNNGYSGKSKPVFDLDSFNGLQLIAEMNRGLEHEIMRKKTRLSPTHFFAGAAFSPFKQMEAEVMGQYFKLKKKISAGADFIISQVGYDARKWHENKLWLQTHELKVPVLANIYVLTYSAAKAMRENSVPGCVVTDDLLSQIAAESISPDKGKKARLERGAKMYAIAKGLGFSGAYISGQGLPYESVEYIISRGSELIGNWQDLVREFDYPQDNGFYYFEKDLRNGLNLDTPAIKNQKPVRSLNYSFSWAAHTTIFEPKSPLFKLMRGLAEKIDSSKMLKKPFGSFENWVKTILYGCKDCGDCALFEVGYLCPVSQCPKEQRNAPCGGSFEGWCEVYPYEKQCIWVKAYLRLKSQHKEDSIGDLIVPPRDWELWQTPSWLNYFLGRDHISKRTGIKPPNNRL